MEKIYKPELVDAAKDIVNSYYHEGSFESDCKLIKTFTDKGLGLDGIYSIFAHKLEFMFIQGIRYAIDNQVAEIYHDRIDEVCDYCKNKDFAFMFDFSDNDFGMHFEKAAELYCKSYNYYLTQVDSYSKMNLSKEIIDMYIKDVDTIEQLDKIKEFLKIGVASMDLEKDIDLPNLDTISWEKTKNDMNRLIDDYLPWDGTKKSYELIDNKWIEKDELPRFVVGTRADIELALPNYGSPDKEPKREFPVWCNGEMLIVYMKNNKLTYIIR